MNPTKIDYLEYTWNPCVGCNGVGCAVRDKCWARAQAKRRQHACTLCYEFKPHFHEERLHQPSKVKKPSKIGVCFMADLFDAENKRDWHEKIFNEIRACPQHLFYVLTKQPQNIPLGFYEENVWLGVTVNRASDLWRVTELKRKCRPDQLMWVSFEPLYEDVSGVDLTDLDWIVIGAQTRPSIQPEKEWVEALITKAKEQRVGMGVTLKNNLTVMKQ